MIPPPAQRAMSDRTGAKVIEVAGSHAIYVSQPGAVADLIDEAPPPSAPGSNPPRLVSLAASAQGVARRSRARYRRRGTRLTPGILVRVGAGAAP